MYELPKSNYRIKRDKHGRETIIIKAGAQAYSDIARLLASDQTLVTVQPFSGHLSKTEDFSNLSELLKELQQYNTLPVLDPVYDEIYQMLEAGNIDPIELKKWYTDDVPQEYKKHYTPGILKKDYQEKYAQSMYHSFLRSLDMIATRIPTQNMSSIMPMKVASLTNLSSVPLIINTSLLYPLEFENG